MIIPSFQTIQFKQKRNSIIRRVLKDYFKILKYSTCRPIMTLLKYWPRSSGCVVLTISLNKQPITPDPTPSKIEANYSAKLEIYNTKQFD